MPSINSVCAAAAPGSRTEERGFTLTELLMVIGVLALLALAILPAMAGGRDKATRARCADNLRQLHTASMQFANDNDQWLPLWRAGQGSRENEMSASHYCRYVYAGYPNTFVPPGPPPSGATFENAGYLYGAGLIDPQMLYCPTLLNGPYSGEYYSPLLTSDAGGTIRSGYFYNPRVINAGNQAGQPIDYHRRYEKTTQLEPHKLFGSDVIGGTFEWAHAHSTERGWNVLFTDGSVVLSMNEQVYEWAATGDISYDARGLDRGFDLMEQGR